MKYHGYGLCYHANDEICNGQIHHKEGKRRLEAFVRIFEHRKTNQEISWNGNE